MFILRAFTIVLCLNNCDALLRLSLIETSIEEQMSRCIIGIGSRYSKKDGPVMVLTPHMLPDELPKLLEHRHQPIHGETLLRILNSETNWTFILPGSKIIAPQLVIVLLNSSSTSQVTLLNKLFTKGREKYLFRKAFYIIASINIQTTSNMTKRLAQLLLLEASRWFRFPKVIVVNPKALADRKFPRFNIFTSLKHTEQDPCVKLPIKATLIDQWRSETGDFRSGSNLIPSEEGRDMRGCPVLVVSRPMPILVNDPSQTFDNETNSWRISYKGGIDIKILEVFANISNFEIVYVNRTSMSVRDLYIGNIDIFTPFWFHHNSHVHFDVVYPHFMKEITWFVPQGPDYPRWTCNFRIFKPEMWLLLLLAFLSGSFVLYLSQKIQNIKDGEEKEGILNRVLLNNLKIHLGACVSEEPTGTFKIFFIVWLFYCLQINTAYQSCLIGFLANPGQLPTIRSLKELNDSRMKLMTNFLFDKNNDALNINKMRMAEQIEVCIGLKCNNRITSKQRIAIFCTKAWFESVVAHCVRFRNKPFYVALEENVEVGHMSMLLTSGSPMYHPLRRLMARIKSAGLIDKWRRDVLSTRMRIVNVQPHEEGPFVISFYHLQGTFYLYLLGILTSSTTFVIERILFSSTFNKRHLASVFK